MMDSVIFVETKRKIEMTYLIRILVNDRSYFLGSGGDIVLTRRFAREFYSKEELDKEVAKHKDNPSLTVESESS